jgi:hypothetical protein
MSSATVSTTGTPAVIPFISKSRPVTTIVGGATMLSIAMTSADIRRPTQLSGRSQCSSPPTGENTRIRLSRVRHRPLSVPRLSAARWGRKEIFGWRCKWMLNLLRLRRDSQRDIHTSYIRPEFSYTYIHVLVKSVIVINILYSYIPRTAKNPRRNRVGSPRLAARRNRASISEGAVSPDREPWRR